MRCICAESIKTYLFATGLILSISLVSITLASLCESFKEHENYNNQLTWDKINWEYKEYWNDVLD